VKNEGLDFLIMGCDGIWEEKSSGEMVGWVRGRLGKKGLGPILEELLGELVSKNSNESESGLDNMSAILIRFLKGKK
jgi:serine/threonine protein phosphatase PrpC